MDPETFAILQEHVHLEVDIILQSVSIEALERRVAGKAVVHPVRVLVVYRVGLEPDGASRKADREVIQALEKWWKSSRADFKKILNRLETAAREKEIHNTNTLKPVQHPEGKGLFEVVGKGGKARLFVFYDPPAGLTLVAVGAYKKRGWTKQKERVAQDEAILRAAKKRSLWIAADPIPGLEDFRVVRGRRSRT